MRGLIAIVVLTLVAAPAMAQKKSCEELKSEIEAKLKANGVKAYTLTIVPNADVKDGKVVGSCDGGTKKITYARSKAASMK
ncbi:MAG: DUF1161 domain-containing protein [Betaproteobacteria bacterium]|nr:DUF1161 domain-containing protein [Betaproteobacteria bacterium]